MSPAPSELAIRLRGVLLTNLRDSLCETVDVTWLFEPCHRRRASVSTNFDFSGGRDEIWRHFHCLHLLRLETFWLIDEYYFCTNAADRPIRLDSVSLSRWPRSFAKNIDIGEQIPHPVVERWEIKKIHQVNLVQIFDSFRVRLATRKTNSPWFFVEYMHFV